jgi:hypothetical protein
MAAKWVGPIVRSRWAVSLPAIGPTVALAGMSEVTDLLDAIANGEPQAAEQHLP